MKTKTPAEKKSSYRQLCKRLAAVTKALNEEREEKEKHRERARIAFHDVERLSLEIETLRADVQAHANSNVILIATLEEVISGRQSNKGKGYASTPSA